MTPLARRRLLAALPLVLVLPGCTSEPEAPPPPDPLAALAEQARKDAAAADAVAKAAPDLATLAGDVAKARTEHARLLQAEVDRERPPASTAPSATSTAPPPAAGTKATLVEALKAAEQKSAELVPSVSRYRAGLLGSIAAGCASLREVLT
ncbi:hypothetical protein [Actinocrispum sp. NPDC049592]|uniref:hypothetical protein n=1 Tax=Actinocrispum sp. NPDC049592 TaxID=3154835 RepID=UPI00342FD70B